MVYVFGATSTTEDVLSGINLRGKRIFVTGVSAGPGVGTARSLAAHGAHVVGAVRDLKKAEAATAQVRKDARWVFLNIWVLPRRQRGSLPQNSEKVPSFAF
jgi:NAD(P)-dependent dehydrogenase (short-subunit alcohol dehydrogenase family)